MMDCDDIINNSKHKHSRTIIHIDLDCFYAQVEMLKNPYLFTKPLGITQQHNVITCNYLARELGVKKCMLIKEVLTLCPEIVLINGEDLHDYRLMSSSVTKVIKQFSSKVEKLGLDENFVDITDLVSTKIKSNNDKTKYVKGHIYENKMELCTCGCSDRLIFGSYVAQEIRERIKDELGMTCSAGISHNKLLAKLVSSCHKPNEQTTILPCSVPSLLSKINTLEEIPGIGRKTNQVLCSLGINNVSDIQKCSIYILETYLGKDLALTIKSVSFGVDDSDVRESGKPQVIGIEEASKGFTSMKDVNTIFKSLIERGLTLLNEDGRYPSSIRVTVRKYCHGQYTRKRESKQCPINPSVFKRVTANNCIHEICLSLFKKLVDHKKAFHLTLIGIAFTKFENYSLQNNSVSNFLMKMPDELSYCTMQVKKIDPQVDLLDKNHAVGEKSLVDHDLNSTQDHNKLLEFPTTKSMPSSTLSCHTTKYAVKCPAELNLDVFRELPQELQMEISQNYDASLKCVLNHKAKLKKEKSIMNYFKK